MALHTTSLVSRHNLAHPNEKSTVPVAYERVLKFNPNHGPDGKFTVAELASRIDPAKANAFWNSLSPTQRKRLVTDLQKPSTLDRLAPIRRATGWNDWSQLARVVPPKQTPAAHDQKAQHANAHIHGTSDGGLGPGGGTIESGTFRSRRASRP